MCHQYHPGLPCVLDELIYPQGVGINWQSVIQLFFLNHVILFIFIYKRGQKQENHDFTICINIFYKYTFIYLKIVMNCHF